MQRQKPEMMRDADVRFVPYCLLLFRERLLLSAPDHGCLGWYILLICWLFSMRRNLERFAVIALSIAGSLEVIITFPVGILKDAK